MIWHTLTSVTFSRVNISWFVENLHHIIFISDDFNWLAPGRCSCDLNLVIFKLTSRIDFLGTSCEIAFRCMPQDVIHDKSKLVQVFYLVPSVNRPIHEPMWTRISVTMHIASPGHTDLITFHFICNFEEEYAICYDWSKPVFTYFNDICTCHWSVTSQSYVTDTLLFDGDIIKIGFFYRDVK